MLFNSREFLFYFLPFVIAGFIILGGHKRYRFAAIWLVGASLIFYGWWNPSYVPLFIASMVFNYSLGRWLAKTPSKRVLIFGVVANLLLLAYYKYTSFAISATSQILGTNWEITSIALPLAISFFTFQQIAFLSDAYDGQAEEPSFVDYCLFISFFPHLIAGPITHHREMLFQFRNPETFSPRIRNISIGLTLFALGLFKKVAIADVFGEMARPVFAGAAAGATPHFTEAWGGAIAYAIQIYFDFSGYTDMAIGLGIMFGIHLPQNFDSPYKARNIIEFWSRWHMTLTRFLTAYVYNPLVLRANRARMRAGKPPVRAGRHTLGSFATLLALPTITTMFLSGVWHGAGWQFVIFGLLHGSYLTVNHTWRVIKERLGFLKDGRSVVRNAAAVLLTFACVTIALVFFRAADVPTALSVTAGMAGLNGLAIHPTLTAVPGISWLASVFAIPISESAFLDTKQLAWIAFALLIVWGTPNTQQWMRHYETALNQKLRPDWVSRVLPSTSLRLNAAFGVLIGCVAMFSLVKMFSQAPTEFLYFQF